MLLEYSFKNFHSFGEEAYFSLRVTEDARKNFPDNYIHGSCDVLRSLSYLKSLFKENSSVESSLKHMCDTYNDGDKLEIDCLGIKRESFAPRIAEQADMKLVLVLNRSEENISLTDTVGQIQLKNRGRR